MLDTIKGELRIFTKEVKGKKGKRTLYNACIGFTKTEDDEYINAYVPVSFSKKVDVKSIKNGTDIVVKEAWFTAYLDKEDVARVKLFVNKAKVVAIDEDDEDDEDVEPEEKPKKTSKKAKKTEEDDE